MLDLKVITIGKCEYYRIIFYVQSENNHRNLCSHLITKISIKGTVTSGQQAIMQSSNLIMTSPGRPAGNVSRIITGPLG